MSQHIDGKIAVFISGPIRYVTLVNKRLEHIFRECDYDCFFHLRKADLGNKARCTEDQMMGNTNKLTEVSAVVR